MRLTRQTNYAMRILMYCAANDDRLSRIPEIAAAAEISLFDVVRITEENFAMAECFEADADCPLIDSCALNSALREALNAFFEVLGRYTIADLVAARPNVRSLLGIDLLERRAPASAA